MNPFSEKQLQFIIESTKKWNLAHGSVRSGKTIGTLFRFMQAVDECPDSHIYMVGHSSDTIYRNAVQLLFSDPVYSVFRPYCTWKRNRLLYKDKTIVCLGAKDQGCIGSFQGNTWSLGYCDEITLYPEPIIDMIDTRLSKPHSMGFASMNPSHPSHKVKKWIDMAIAGDPNYYHLHYTLEDNPFVDQAYKDRIRKSLSGIFYKRNYLGLWCVAEGAIFDFFDHDLHVVKRPPRAAEYFLAGIDYGISNAFSCVVIGVSTGRYTQTGKCMWVEAEYYWDCKKTGRQKLNSEFATDIEGFLEPYGVNSIFIDPSALAMKLELQRRGMHVIEANNDVKYGIETMTSEMSQGNLFVMNTCKNLIREIEGYVWDSRKSEQGEDAPLKKSDHAIDAMRYVLASHVVPVYQPYQQNHDPNKYLQNRFQTSRRFY